MSDMADSEYEDWKPSVIERWNAFKNGQADAKQYTAFLRFVFKAYNIPARAHIRWMNRSNKCLQILYDGQAGTMDEMRGYFDEIRDIIRAFQTPCDLAYEWNVKYNDFQVWERKASNGPAYARMAMCVGKGTMPYMPPELREAIITRVRLRSVFF